MLTSLTIDNYTIIEHLEIDFHSGLNIITGQTGAGKSILLGALSCLAGNKTDVSSLLNSEKNGVIEGVFAISGYDLKELLLFLDVEYDDTLTIRRVISPTGKSRAFVNDNPVTLTTLKTLSERLIDIHSQHQSLLLANKEFQIRIVDSIAQHTSIVEQYRVLFLEHSKKTRSYKRAIESSTTDQKHRELLQYYIDEILDLGLKEGEYSSLEEEYKELTHASDIIESLSLAHSMIDGEPSVINNLRQALSNISSASKHAPKLEELAERINSCYIELKDIDNEIQDSASQIELNPNRLQQIESRLDSVNNILHKHSLSDEQELKSFQDNIDQELLGYTQGESSLEEQLVEIGVLLKKMLELSSVISVNRHKSVSKIEKYVVSVMKQLGIKDIRFIVDISSDAECLTQTGMDSVVFLFSANSVSVPRPLDKVASGGEISRLMLALKGLLAKNIQLPTIIFDEIDTGVSGNIADKMGDIISDMASSMQVVNITHLPQIASKGEHHLYVYKDKQTNIKYLTKQERIEHIAEMLSGSNVTDAAREQAKALLGVSKKG